MRQLISASALHHDGRHGPGWVEVDTVSSLVVAVGQGSPGRPVDERVDGVLAPGLVDVQMNGGYGVDFRDAGLADWEHVVDRLPSSGVTAVVPTFITAPWDEVLAQLSAYARVRKALEGRPGAARLLPAHLEGPFLSRRRRGAHREEWLRHPDASRIEELVALGDALGYVTLAPELPGAVEAVAILSRAGVRVAVGHSDADAETVHRAADAGATLVTHLYNAQSPLHHRAPGVVGAALTDPRLSLGLIADGHHVHADAIAVAFSCAPGRVMLVSDNVSAFAMAPGEYRLGDEPVTVRSGRPPLRADGTIAGAAVGLDTCIGHVVRSAGIDPYRAIDAATATPADAVGADGHGRLTPGARADLVHLDPETFEVRSTWIAGVRAH